MTQSRTVSEPPKRSRGRPRREGTDDAILEATRALLRETGYGGFTVDGVAERTGIAKTTIYRRWPSKGALVAAAIAPLAPQTGDAESILRETAEVLALLSSPDAEALDVIRAVIVPRRELLREAMDATAADEKIGALLVRLIAGDDIRRSRT